MNRAILAPLALSAALLAGLVAAPLANSQTSGIVINDADATNTLTMVPSAPLLTLITDLAPRFVVEYANAMRFYSIVPPSEPLLTLLGQTSDHVVLQYADGNRFYGLSYPKALFNDQAPPQIGDLNATLTVTLSSNNQITVAWLTNEVVTTTFEYGFASGVYTTVLTEMLLFRLHEFGILDVPPGTTVYYRIRHIDRSGNILQSEEYHYDMPLLPTPTPTPTVTPTVTPVPPKLYIYLPLVRR